MQHGPINLVSDFHLLLFRWTVVIGLFSIELPSHMKLVLLRKSST